MPDAVPPFAVPRALPPCPALVALAARSALGGAREALLGTVMAVRLLEGLCAPYPLPRAARVARAEAARLWLGALTLPARARTALLRAFAASSADDRSAAAEALAAVTDVTAPHLDKASRSELARLGDRLREARVLAGVPGRTVA